MIGRRALRLSPPPDEEPSALTDLLADDLTLRDVERLGVVFPGVPPRLAAVALLRDALDAAEDINKGRACAQPENQIRDAPARSPKTK